MSTNQQLIDQTAARALVEAEQPKSLTACLELDDEDLFTEPMLARALELLTDQAGGLVAVVETPVGRKEINKLSRAVGGAITRLNERRRKFVAELKARPKAIDDLFRTTFREPAEAMKERVRRPLDEWTEAQRAAEEETTHLIELLNAPVELGTSAADLAARLEEARNLDLPNWLSETQRDALVAAMQNAIPRLEAAHSAAVQAETQAAELERLRLEAEKRERKEREELIRREAAEQAGREAEERAQVERVRAEQARQEAERRQKEAERQALEAEQRRQREAEEAERRAKRQAEEAARRERERIEAERQAAEEERRRREADREHRAEINRAVLAGLVAIGLSEEQGRAVIGAVVRGQVRHTTINY